VVPISAVSPRPAIIDDPIAAVEALAGEPPSDARCVRVATAVLKCDRCLLECSASELRKQHALLAAAALRVCRALTAAREHK
jgi:hypothetical protein